MSTSSRIIKNTGFLYGKMAISVFVSLYTTRVILNSLGASDYGVFNVVGGTIALLGFLNSSMASATQRFMSYAEGQGKDEEKARIFNNAVLLHLGIALLMGVLWLLLEPVFFNYVLNIEPSRVGAAHWVYRCTIVSTMFTVMTVPYDAALNAHENMLYYAIVGLMDSFLKLAIALMVAHWGGDKLILYGILMPAECLVVLIIMRIYCTRRYEECRLALRKFANRQTLRQLTGFAGWNLLGTSASVISGYGSGLVLNHFFGTRLNAANGVCGQLNGQMLAFSNNMLKAVNPVIVKSEGAGDRARMFKAAFSACKVSTFLYGMIAVPFVVECGYILQLWLKQVPEYTQIFCSISVAVVILEQLYLPLNTSINAVGKIRGINIFGCFVHYGSIILLFLGYLLGLPPYLLVIIAGVASIARAIYSITYATRHCSMDFAQYSSDVVLRCLLVLAASFAVSMAVRNLLPESFLRLALVCIASFATFLLMAYRLGLTTSERTAAQTTLTEMASKIFRRKSA